MAEQFSPVLPYGGTEGFVGTPASQSRAEREARTGKAGERQQAVLAYLEEAGAGGATWGEVGAALSLHHGQVSASLSVLHAAGMVFQLQEKRFRAHPYVHHSFSGCYEPSERRDAPSRTKAGELAERSELAMAWLALAEDFWDDADLLKEVIVNARKALEGNDA